MSGWHRRSVPLKFQLGDWTLFSVALPLQERAERLGDAAVPVEAPSAPADELVDGSRGFLIRGLPIADGVPRVSRNGDYICYVIHRYQHCYIDFGQSFDDYQKKFSAKTRSTLNRKVRKFEAHAGGAVRWRTYRTPEEIEAFIPLARGIAEKSYQEKLFGAGLPASAEFIAEARAQAAEDRVRAYLLFDGDKPVSYLYCPAHEDVLLYAYLGYDPEWMHLSVGTVLQWLALKQLFEEGRFRYFDFDEGESDHKRLFATHQRQCANVLLMRRSLSARALIYGHLTVDGLSTWAGSRLDQLGLKKRIRRYLRFGR